MVIWAYGPICMYGKYGMVSKYGKYPAGVYGHIILMVIWAYGI